MHALSTATSGALALLARYHAYTAEGLEHIPKTGGCLVAGTHSLATYESFLLADYGARVTGRTAIFTADRWFFKIDALRPIVQRLGMVDASRDKLVELLKEGNVVAVGPGGMRESLRPKTQRYEIDWEGRLGFVWASILSGAPIVLAACPAADRIFTVYPSALTRLAYERFKLPLALFRGIGPTLLPRPVRLRHVLGPCIAPPCAPEDATEQIVCAHHARLEREMRALISRALRGV